MDELLEKITNDLSEITKLGYRKIIGELMCMFDEQGHRWLPKLLLPNCPESDMLVPAKCR